MTGSRAGSWSLDRRMVLEDLQEEEDDDDDGARSDLDNCGNKIVQEVKYCSKVQFRAPDIIELWWINDVATEGMGETSCYQQRKKSEDGMPAEATSNLESFPVLTKTMAVGAGFVRWKGMVKGNG